MNVDIRPVDERTLLGRVDLDSDNSLRFGFAIEDHGDGRQLVYRNGGYFQGQVRDSRTEIVVADDDAGTWRFCSIPRGCDYIDALFEIDGDTLMLDVTVNGQTHVVWNAERLELRDVDAAFPDEGAGAPDAEFPAMPRADITATWTDPVPAGAQLLLSLSDAPCPVNPTAACAISRWYVSRLSESDTSATMPIDQLHPGTYSLNAVLDRDGNGVPNTGDAVAAPNASLVVPAAPAEASATLNVAIDL
jgi:hypothetical protein